MTLQQGDYIQGLERKQFLEIFKICNVIYAPTKGNKFYYDKKYNKICCHDENEAINRLTPRQFKQRAINTFKS